MTEEYAKDMFRHFQEGMSAKNRKLFKWGMEQGYESVIKLGHFNPKFLMQKDAYKCDEYSFKELYEEMCDLFMHLEAADDKIPMIRRIISLKNVANFKLRRDKRLKAG